MHRKFEELNRVYADLVRKYREIEREKDQVNLEIEDTRRRYRAIEEEYGVLATKIEKYVNQMSRTNARVKERLQSQQALLDDVQPGLTDYLQALFNEGQYKAGAKLWEKLNYRSLNPQCKGCSAYLALVHTLKERGAEESMDEIDQMVDMDRKIEEIINREKREKEAQEAEINRLKEMLQREARKTQVAEEKAERHEIDIQNTKGKAEKIKRDYEEIKKMKGVERIE